MSIVEQLVQANLEAYNQRNIKDFMSHFSDKIELWSYGKQAPNVVGKSAVEAIYSNLFEQSPNLHSRILKRIVFDNKVIDHESILGREGSDEAVEMVLIYEVQESKITKITKI